MTQLLQLEADVFVAPQLVAADFAEIAARGFRSVVNNRPDGEAPDQLPNADAEALAQAHGLAFCHLPVENARVTEDEVVDGSARLLEGLPRPMLFYCRTGTRSTILWAQAAVRRLGVKRTLEIASRAGYDLEVIEDHLRKRAAEPECPVRGAETEAVRRPVPHESADLQICS